MQCIRLRANIWRGPCKLRWSGFQHGLRVFILIRGELRCKNRVLPVPQIVGQAGVTIPIAMSWAQALDHASRISFEPSWKVVVGLVRAIAKYITCEWSRQQKQSRQIRERQHGSDFDFDSPFLLSLGEGGADTHKLFIQLDMLA